MRDEVENDPQIPSSFAFRPHPLMRNESCVIGMD